MSSSAAYQNNGRSSAASMRRPSPNGLRAALRALRRWWVQERHYRPERRYMRG